MATVQRHEIEAWLGDHHGLSAEQITELTRAATQIHDRYPSPDDIESRDAALMTAYRIMTDDTTLLDELAGRLAYARTLQIRALAGMRQAALTLVPDGEQTEAGIARTFGVTRMTIREWLGKR